MDEINNNRLDKGSTLASGRRQGFATTVETATFLNLSRQAVSQKVLAGEIPGRRYGRSLRIPWDWLYEEQQRAREERPAAAKRASAGSKESGLAG